jgi:hypothetical protein
MREKKSLILGLLLIAFVVIPGARLNAQRGSKAPANDLKQKAKQHGKFVVELATPPPAYNELEQLAANSSNIVIGVAQQNVCRLSRDGNSITTDYQVTLEHHYKGKFRKGNTITVSLPGGLVQFPDGTSAETRTPWFRKLQQGETYLFFLNGSSDGKLVPTGDAQGIFQIPTTKQDRLVKTQSGRSQDPIWKYNKVDVINFLKHVRAVAK